MLVGFDFGYPNLCLSAESLPAVKKTDEKKREQVISTLRDFAFRHPTFSQDEIVAEIFAKTKVDPDFSEALTRSEEKNEQDSFLAKLPTLSKEELLALELNRLKSIEECDDSRYYLSRSAWGDPDEAFKKSWKGFIDNPFDALMKTVTFGTYLALDTVAALYTVPKWLSTCHE